MCLGPDRSRQRRASGGLSDEQRANCTHDPQHRDGLGPHQLCRGGFRSSGAVRAHKHLWRRQLTGLSDIRRCVAVDLLAHGDTEINPSQDVSVTANANMLREVLDGLKIDRVDLVGNDSGGGISQIFAALNPERCGA